MQEVRAVDGAAAVEVEDGGVAEKRQAEGEEVAGVFARFAAAECLRARSARSARKREDMTQLQAGQYFIELRGLNRLESLRIEMEFDP